VIVCGCDNTVVMSVCLGAAAVCTVHTDGTLYWDTETLARTTQSRCQSHCWYFMLFTDVCCQNTLGVTHYRSEDNWKHSCL